MKVSIFKIITTDFVATLSFIVIVFVVPFLLLDDFFNWDIMPHTFRRKIVIQHNSNNENFNNVSKIDKEYNLTIFYFTFFFFFLFLLLFRIVKISNHFKNGIEVEAKVIHLEFEKDRGRVEYEYKIGGKKYKSGNFIMKKWKTEFLNVGQKVIVVVSKNNYNKALIKDLYL